MARLFNGTSDSATMSPSVSAYSVLSLSFWLFMAVNPAAERVAIVGASTITAVNTFDFEPKDSSAGNGSVTMSTSGGLFWVDTYVQPAANAWHHYAITYDRTGPTNTLSIDGQPAALTARQHNAGAYGNFGNSTWLLMTYPPQSWFQPGTMCELAVWGGWTLTPFQVATLAAGVSATRVQAANLINYWPDLQTDIAKTGGNNVTLTGTTEANGPSWTTAGGVIVPRAAPPILRGHPSMRLHERPFPLAPRKRGIYVPRSAAINFQNPGVL